MKSELKWWSALGMGLLYLILVFASCFVGYVHPVCWAFYSVLAAVLAAGPYFWLAARWQGFGAGTILSALVVLFCWASGEADGLASKAFILCGGILSDLVRLWLGSGSRKALYASWPLAAVGNIGWVINLWIRPDWYVEGAVEEMGAAYAEGIAALQSPWYLGLCVALTAAVAVLAIWLCGMVDKKSARLLSDDTAGRNSGVLRVILAALVYVVIFLLGSTSGLIHPACYAYIGALLPLLFAFVYLYVASVMQWFGAATVLNGTLLAVGQLTGEADTAFIIGIIALTVIAEIVRYFCNYDTLKGVRWSFLPFALSFFAYTAHWWTDTEGSLAAAVEEMRTGYDQLMMPVINNIPVLVVVVLVTIPVSILAMRLAERALPKQASLLK